MTPTLRMLCELLDLTQISPRGKVLRARAPRPPPTPPPPPPHRGAAGQGPIADGFCRITREKRKEGLDPSEPSNN
eukprot:3523904-Pyramimonas_sp.AAC.1